MVKKRAQFPDLPRENMMVDFVFLIKRHHYGVKGMSRRFCLPPNIAPEDLGRDRMGDLVIREWAGMEKLLSYADLLAHQKPEKGLGM